MKDATGELSMTAVAVVAIAAISVVFTTLVWPTIKTTIMRNSYCSQAFGCGAADEDGMAECSYCADDTVGDGNTVTCDDIKTIRCPANNNNAGN